MLGSETVQNRDILRFSEVRNGDGFGQRSGVGIEPAAVDVDQDMVGLVGTDFQGSDNPDRYPGHGMIFYALDRVDRLGCRSGPGLPFIYFGPALLKRFLEVGIRGV